VVGESSPSPKTINYRPFKPEMDGAVLREDLRNLPKTGMPLRQDNGCGNRGICLRALAALSSRKRGAAGNRMGFIQAGGSGVPVWYLKGIPSYVAILLDMPLRDVEQIVYFKLLLWLLDKGDTRISPYKQLLHEDEWLEIEDQIYAKILRLRMSRWSASAAKSPQKPA